MRKQYFLVDEEGYPIDSFLLDPSYDVIPPNCYVQWEGSLGGIPRWNFEKSQWEDATPYEEKFRIAKMTTMGYMTEAFKKEVDGLFTIAIRGEEYQFSFDLESQGNFNTIARLFDKGLIDTVRWTVVKDGETTRIDLSEEEVNHIIYTGFRYKYDRICKFRDVLEPRVNACTTIEEVSAITWDDVEA